MNQRIANKTINDIVSTWEVITKRDIIRTASPTKTLVTLIRRQMQVVNYARLNPQVLNRALILTMMLGPNRVHSDVNSPHTSTMLTVL